MTCSSMNSKQRVLGQVHKEKENGGSNGIIVVGIGRDLLNMYVVARHPIFRHHVCDMNRSHYATLLVCLTHRRFHCCMMHTDESKSVRVV